MSVEPGGLNATHDPALKSHVAAANAEGADFPIQNLPHGVFSRGSAEPPRGAVAIGDQLLDMRALVESGLLQAAQEAAAAAAGPELNRLMAMPAAALSTLRAELQRLLAADFTARERISACLIPLDQVRMHLPAQIGAFTDYMTSAPHIAAARPAKPEGRLPPCFWSLPIAYNSRASSITPSGRGVERPWGQYAADGEVRFGPSTALDYELEFGCFVGAGNALGAPVPLREARRHIFGYCLVNDWSARDFQMWESVLGPFQAKSFRTSISPWVVTAEAMAPFRKALPARPEGVGPPPPHLHSAQHDADGGLSVAFMAEIRTAQMRETGAPPQVITRTAFDAGAWSFEQMLTHHAIGGCNLRPGDLLGSGTLSGVELESAACMAEMTGGRVPVRLENGEERLWLHDGDEIIFRARAEHPAYVGIGFGTCCGRILPAAPFQP